MGLYVAAFANILGLKPYFYFNQIYLFICLYLQTGDHSMGLYVAAFANILGLKPYFYFNQIYLFIFADW